MVAPTLSAKTANASAVGKCLSSRTVRTFPAPKSSMAYAY